MSEPKKNDELVYWKETVEEGKLKLSENILDLANQINNIFSDLNFEGSEFDYAFSLVRQRTEALESQVDALKEQLEDSKWMAELIISKRLKDAEARLESVVGVIDESPGFDENSPGQFSTAYRDFLKKLNDALGGGGCVEPQSGEQPTETGEKTQ